MKKRRRLRPDTWVLMGAAAVVVGALVLWLGTRPPSPPDGSAPASGVRDRATRPGQTGAPPPRTATASRRRQRPTPTPRQPTVAPSTPVPSPPTPAPAEPPPAEPPQVKLLGTVVVKGGSRALVEEVARGQRLVYREGQVVRGWTVEKILEDRMVFVRGPDSEVVYLESARPSGGPPGKTLASVSVSREQVKKVIHQDIGKLVSDFAVVPEFSDTGLTGVRLDGLPPLPDGLDKKIGLVPGDVIRSINGEPLTDPAVAFTVYQGLLDGSLEQVSIAIERGGEQFVLQYNFE